ncbi:MAG: hypothetical protein ACREXR_02905 [Gammaproteobacteria bacterium]
MARSNRIAQALGLAGAAEYFGLDDTISDKFINPLFDLARNYLERQGFWDWLFGGFDWLEGKWSWGRDKAEDISDLFLAYRM